MNPSFAIFKILGFGLLANALFMFSACRNNGNSQADIDHSTVSHLAGDTIKQQSPAERFAALGVTDPSLVTAFVQKLKKTLEQNDAFALSLMCSFPLRLNVQEDGHEKSKHSEIATAKEFIAQYKTIFTEATKNAIIKQPEASLFANYQGLMLGENGQVWAQYDEARHEFLIFALNIEKAK